MTGFLRRTRGTTCPAPKTRTVRATDRRARRAARDKRTRLLAELASYRTQAERAELETILARHCDADAAPVRALIA